VRFSNHCILFLSTFYKASTPKFSAVGLYINMLTKSIKLYSKKVILGKHVWSHCFETVLGYIVITYIFNAVALKWTLETPDPI